MLYIIYFFKRNILKNYISPINNWKKSILFLKKFGSKKYIIQYYNIESRNSSQTFILLILISKRYKLKEFYCKNTCVLTQDVKIIFWTTLNYIIDKTLQSL